jgi:hypothetical protein
MTEEQAEAKLQRMTDSSVEPLLSSTDLDDLLEAAARPDSSGLLRGDSGWTPTWDLDAGAAEGWTRKAGKAASRFSFAEDGQQFSRAQVYAHCAKMRDIYARRSMTSVTVSSQTSAD